MMGVKLSRMPELWLSGIIVVADQAAKGEVPVRRHAAFEESDLSKRAVVPSQPAAADEADRLGAMSRYQTLAPASAPAPTHAAAPPAIQWRVRDVTAAAAEVNTWVAAKQGQIVATDAHHLSVTLPASAVPEFLQRFSSSTLDGRAADQADHAQVTLSLELVPSE